VDKEYTAFLEERATGITEILELRKAVAEEELRKKNERMEVEREEEGEKAKGDEMDAEQPKSADVEMDVDDHDSATLGTAESKEVEDEMEKKEEPTVTPADGDDAVEY